MSFSNLSRSLFLEKKRIDKWFSKLIGLNLKYSRANKKNDYRAAALNGSSPRYRHLLEEDIVAARASRNNRHI